jgi:hypothetical protein
MRHFVNHIKHGSKQCHSTQLLSMVRLASSMVEVSFMRKLLFPFLMMFLLVLPSTAQAQSSITLDSLQISIWPEYDKPSVLIIYQMNLSANTNYPATLSIRIPSAAGEPNAVAARQVDGSLFTIEKTRQVVGEWALITFTTTTPELQIEYYDPSLSINGSARHFTYLWPADYSVSQLSIQVQQPFDASQMRISPSLGGGALGDNNLTYYTQDLGMVSAGQDFQITIDYQKSSDVLSAENLPIEPSASIPQGTVGDINLKTWLPWVLGILGAALIIGGIVWFWQSGRQRPAPQPRRRRTKSPALERDTLSSSAGEEIYCSQCGKRASPGDQFCRYCGSSLRIK